jgi:hypothetical protein
MNEKIKALAVEATLAQIYNGTDHPHLVGKFFPQLSGPTTEQLEKFAELIVKECADAADMGADATEYVGDYVAEHMGFGQDEGVTTWRTK